MSWFDVSPITTIKMRKSTAAATTTSHVITRMDAPIVLDSNQLRRRKLAHLKLGWIAGCRWGWVYA